MTSKEAFKVGFLTYCAERGLTGEQVTVLMQKAAALIEKIAFDYPFKSTVEKLPAIGMGAAIAAPIAAGAGIGYMAHKLHTPQIDNDDIKKRELIEELRHYARRAREQQRVKSLRLFNPGD